MSAPPLNYPVLDTRELKRQNLANRNQQVFSDQFLPTVSRDRGSGKQLAGWNCRRHKSTGDQGQELVPTVQSGMRLDRNPLGTFPHIEECPPVPYKFITPGHYLFDLIYNPAKTLFLQKGEEKGAAIKNGADMLEIQAEDSWRIWNEEK